MSGWAAWFSEHHLQDDFERMRNHTQSPDIPKI